MKLKLVNAFKSIKNYRCKNYLFFPQFAQTFTYFYQKFTVVNCKSYLPFTDLPISGVNFKNFTAINHKSTMLIFHVLLGLGWKKFT
jgi:hypothetical protein